MHPIPLSALKRGQLARIASIAGDEQLGRKLDEMGIIEGLEVSILHRGLIGGDPLAVRMSDRVIALRRRDASHIAVELLCN